MRKLRDYARSFAETLDARKAYKWASGVCAAAALALVVSESREPQDPFIHLDPNTRVAPIIRDVYQNGGKGRDRAKDEYHLNPAKFQDDSLVSVEVPLGRDGLPKNSLKMTTLKGEFIERPTQEFPDLDGDGDCDSDDPNLDSRYSRLVVGINEEIKYRNMARAVFDYVGKNGAKTTVWEPYFSKISWLSFWGRDVESPNSPRTVTLNKDTEEEFGVSAEQKGSFGCRELTIHHITRGHPFRITLDTGYGDPGVFGHARFDRNTNEYRAILKKVAEQLGLEVE